MNKYKASETIFGDNRGILIKSCGYDDFCKGVSLLFNDRLPARHFINETGKISLFWKSTGEETPLPYEMDLNATTDFLWNWLNSNPQDYPEMPCIDGDCKKGFLITRSNEDFFSIISVEKCWICYHK